MLITFTFLLIVLKRLCLQIVVDCGPLMEPSNGRVVTSNGTTYKSTATYSCYSGYALSGPESRTCEADGDWIIQISSVCESK